MCLLHFLLFLYVLTKFNHRLRIYCLAVKKNSDLQVTAVLTRIHTKSVVCQFPLAKMCLVFFFEKCVDLQVTG